MRPSVISASNANSIQGDKARIDTSANPVDPNGIGIAFAPVRAIIECQNGTDLALGRVTNSSILADVLTEVANCLLLFLPGDLEADHCDLVVRKIGIFQSRIARVFAMISFSVVPLGPR